jgi:hypothetical protein
MKRFILLILISLPLIAVSQSMVIDTLCFELPYRKLAPAPCSIEDTSVVEAKLYMVKVGLYDRKIEAREYIIRIDLGSQYHYFYSQIFNSRNKASVSAANLRNLGYCDAYVVELPSMIMGFEFPTQSVQATPSKVTQINPSQPVQSGGKFTWTKQ